MKTHRRSSLGFTLLELLVVMAIVAVLFGLLFGVMGKIQHRSRAAKEVNAGRQLVNAFLSYASDHEGKFMLGFDKREGSVQLANGTAVGSPATHRYPYRLARYFQENIQDIILVNKNAKQVGSWDNYRISLFPAFGINSFYVGGYYDDEMALAGEAAESIAQVESPSSLLVFATAAYISEGDRVEGFHTVEPPNRKTVYWATGEYDPERNPSDYGHVDPRYDGKALCVFLDGSLRYLTVPELKDMRLWNIHAKAEDNPNYLVARSSSSGRPGGR
jgi:prepilin-type N-terminal cleavage/methylation domain-containing protein